MSDKKYDAFISYRHRPVEQSVAKQLVFLLGSKTGPNGKKLRIFRDRDELPTEKDLSNAIRGALEDSRFLIVICSPEYSQSEWCMEELRYFRALHGNSNANVLPILVEGEPEESFPEELFWEKQTVLDADGQETTEYRKQEPLGADVRANNWFRRTWLLWWSEHLRLVSPIVGKPFAQLFQRSTRRRILLSILFTAILLLGMLLFNVYNLNMLNRVEAEHQAMLANESLRLAVASEECLAAGDGQLAMLLALEALPEDLSDPERPLILEAEAALRSAVYSRMQEEQEELLQCLATVNFDGWGWELVKLFDGNQKIAVTDREWLSIYDSATGMTLFRYPSDFYATAQLNQDGTLLAQVTPLGEEGNLKVFRAEVYSITQNKLLFSEILTSEAFGMSACWDMDADICYFYSDMDEGTLHLAVDAEGVPTPNPVLPEDQWDKIWDAYIENPTYQTLTVESDYPAKDGILTGQGERYQAYIEELWKDDYRQAAITEDEQLLIFSTGYSFDRYGSFVIYPLELLEQGIRHSVTLNGAFYVDCINRRIYQMEEEALHIYSYRPENRLTEKGSLDVISMDGSRCLRKRSINSPTDTGLLSIFLCEDLSTPVLEVGYKDSHDYYVTPNLDYAFVKTEDDALQLWGVEQGLLLELDMDPGLAAQACNPCVSADGSLLAMVWAEQWEVAVYSGKDGALLQTIDISPLGDSEYAYGMDHYLEFEGTNLLISVEDLSWIVDITGENDRIEIPDGFHKNGAGLYRMDSVLTGDGLFFCMGDWFEGALGTIYDIKTQSPLFRKVAFTQYSEESGTLLYIPWNPQFGNAMAVHGARRDESGMFVDQYIIALDDSTGQWDNFVCMDDRYFMVQGYEKCMICEIETGNYIMTVYPKDQAGSDNRFCLVDGSIYARYPLGTAVTTYPLMETELLAEQAKEYLTSPLGLRRLTQTERDAYFID